MGLGTILKNLFGEDRPQNTGLDQRLAAVALMVHMMAIDGEVSPEEEEKLKRLIENQYALTGVEADKLIDQARAEDARAVDLYGFTRILKSELSEDQRIHLVEQLWGMVYADGDVHEFEENLVWRISELLAVDPKDRIAMKQKVRAEDLLKDDE